MSDDVDDAERTRLALTTQAQRLEELIAKLETELEEDDNPATQRRLKASAEKLATVQAELAPLNAKREGQLLTDFQKAQHDGLDDQLAVLRHVWRKYRHPRVADLIDCVSIELAAKLPPIPVAELPAVFARRDPAEVGRLITMPWPTTPALEQQLIQSILWLPDDPRVAAVCAREIELRRWGPGAPDYGPFYERLNALGDVRQLPLLERQLTRTNRIPLELDRNAVSVHRALMPELPAEFEAVVAAMESRWTSWRERRDAAEKEKRALLDAVLAEPHDLSKRMVFADWLTEHGDPRGEFISLQLAPPNEESTRRQAELSAAYWTEWLRPLLDVLRGAPVFEGGFPVNAEVRGPLPKEVFAAAEWRTFETLTIGALTAAQVAREPQLVSLRTLRGVVPRDLEQLLATRAPLTCISMEGLGWARETEDDTPEARDFAAMPTLRRLELHDRQALAWVNELPQLKELAVYVELLQNAEQVVATLEGAPIDALEVMFGHGAQTIIRLERDDAGNFAKAVCLRNPRTLPSIVGALPRTLTSLTTATPPARVTQHVVDQFVESLQRFPALEAGELPLVARAPRRFFQLEANGYLFQRSEGLRLLTGHFELELDHYVGPEWDWRREHWTEAGERGEPTLLKVEDRRMTATLPVLEAQALSNALKSFMRTTYTHEATATLDGRVLHFISGQWPSLELVRAFLGG